MLCHPGVQVETTRDDPQGGLLRGATDLLLPCQILEVAVSFEQAHYQWLALQFKRCNGRPTPTRPFISHGKLTSIWHGPMTRPGQPDGRIFPTCWYSIKFLKRKIFPSG